MRPHLYTPTEVNGVPLLEGPAGGGCAMTSREIYDGVGGFQESKGQIFFLEDNAYIEDIKAAGYWAAVHGELKVLHTGGPYYGAQTVEKDAYWERWHRSMARRAAIKRFLLRVPFVRVVNARRGWFEEPEPSSSPRRQLADRLAALGVKARQSARSTSAQTHLPSCLCSR